jgi:hypothetical protein
MEALQVQTVGIDRYGPCECCGNRSRMGSFPRSEAPACQRAVCVALPRTAFLPPQPLDRERVVKQRGPQRLGGACRAWMGSDATMPRRRGLPRRSACDPGPV